MLKCTSPIAGLEGRHLTINIAIETSNQYENQICDMHRSKKFNKTKHSIKTFLTFVVKVLSAAESGHLLGWKVLMYGELDELGEVDLC